MYAEQAELRDYTEHVIDRHRLRERTVLGAEVVAAEWDGEGWNVRTSDGDVAPRPLPGQRLRPAQHPGRARPSPGLDDFEGHAFHTNGWDHDVDLDRQAGRGRRLGRQRGTGDPRDPARGGRAPRLPAQPPLGAPPPRPRLLPAPAARAAPAAPAAGPAHRDLLEAGDPGHRLQAQPLAAAAHRPARGARPHRRPGPRPGPAREAHPRLHDRVQADHPVRHPLPGPGAAQHARSTTAPTASPTSTRPASSPRAGSTSTSTSSSSRPATTPPTASSRTTSAGGTASTLADVWHEFPRAYLGTTVPGLPQLLRRHRAPTPASATPARSS